MVEITNAAPPKNAVPPINAVPPKRRFFGLRSKMLLLFSVVIIFSNSFLLIFSVTRYSTELESNSIRQSDQLVGSLVGNLNEYVQEIEQLTQVVKYYYYVQDYLLRRAGRKQSSLDAESQSANMGVTLLGNIILARTDIASIFLFDDKGIALYKTSQLDLDTGFDFRSQPWHRDALEKPDLVSITGPSRQVYALRNDPPVLSFSRAVDSYDGTGILGVVLFDVNLGTIRRTCLTAKPESDGFVMVLDENGGILYHPTLQPLSDTNAQDSAASDCKALLPSLAATASGHFDALLGEMRYQIVHRTMSRTGWHVISATPYSRITEEARGIRNLILVVGFLCLALVTGVSIVMSNRITKPIVQLRRSMDQAEHGRLDIRVPVTSRDEVGQLSESFNGMLERLDGLMKQVVLDQEEKRKLELTALQHQINPHFLYNTLDSIIWMAEAKDENVVPMTEALAKLFRISLSKGREIIPLRDEIEHAASYLFIQSMRYLNKFTYRIDVPQDLMGCSVVKLILQPLVENSIYHGIKNKPGKGFIEIRAWAEEDNLMVSVSDDGIGMSAETCANLLTSPTGQSSKTSPSGATGPMDGNTGRISGSGFGVRNVDERLRLYFGNHYGLRFVSSPGEGTTATMTLPLSQGFQAAP